MACKTSCTDAVRVSVATSVFALSNITLVDIIIIIILT